MTTPLLQASPPLPREAAVPEWITTREAAEISGDHVNYIRRLIHRGKIEAEKKGAMWWVDGDSLSNPRGGIGIHSKLRACARMGVLVRLQSGALPPR